MERHGKRSLLVPDVKAAETLGFATFLSAYNNLVRRAKDNSLRVDDFAGTTASLTNPGMISTPMSLPRLMDRKAVIVRMGSIGSLPRVPRHAGRGDQQAGPERGDDAHQRLRPPVMQGAGSGQFLDMLVGLLLGKESCYETSSAASACPTGPSGSPPTRRPSSAACSATTTRRPRCAADAVFQLIRSFRVRGHLQADMKPLGYAPPPHLDLAPTTFGLSIWDLDRTFMAGCFGVAPR